MDIRTIDIGKRSRWILVANRGGAKLFAGVGQLDQMKLVQNIPHPEGRRQNHEINTDDGGSRASAGAPRSSGTQQGSGYEPHESAVEHDANVFAKQLCTVLYDGRTKNEFDDLVLIAEPQFLGRIRTALDKETASRVVSSVNHNWMDLTTADLTEKVRELFRGEVH